MTSDWMKDWPRVEEVLDEILELDPAARRARLEALGAREPELRALVERLLRADERSAGFLSAPPWESGDATVADEPEAGASDGDGVLPERIGPWRVVRMLGRGGMGVVLLADRDDGQFTQRVAIKCLTAMVRTPEARVRFLHEREILGRLEHPHIARLLDGGVLSDGSPYFAMEYVAGEPITGYAGRRSLSVDERVRLFLAVCEAVEYAHGRLVVHRDIKPVNILVSDRGEVKLLAFGIAKLLADEAPATATRIMTPAYAAPEQVRGGAVTVATDVFLLGLVLYELLTGSRAHPDDGTPYGWQRAVVETDPARPSGATTSPALARRLQGDLDAIILKALRKEPAERYRSVEALRADLEAWLGHLPVAARRGTTAYRLKKYARRDRWGVAAGLLVSATVVAGVAGVLAQSRVAAAERDRAQSAQQETLAINDFVVNELLLSTTPEKSLGRPLTVAEVLDNAARSADRAFPGQPGRSAAVRLTLARAYAALGRFADASTHAVAAREQFTAAAGPDAPETIRARILVADIAAENGHTDEAIAGLTEVVSTLSPRAAPGDLDLLAARSSLGRALGQGERWQEGEEL